MINQALALINNYICTNQMHKVAEPLAIAKTLQPKHAAYEFFDRNEPCLIFGKNWEGQDLNGKSLEIFCDHGMGDTIMMLRYIKKLKESFDVKIILNSLVYKPFESFMNRLDFIDVFAAIHEGCDFHTNIMQLPQIYHQTLMWEQIEKPPDQPLLKTSRFPLNPKFGFGLKYQSTKQSGLFEKKSIDPELFSDWDYVSLEPTDTTRDIDYTMSTMQHLPVIVSVDTMTLHLAGSMGLKTIGLLCHDHDVRWGKEEKTPWYPSITLLRQEKAGDWGKVLQSLKILLTKEI